MYSVSVEASDSASVEILIFLIIGSLEKMTVQMKLWLEKFWISSGTDYLLYENENSTYILLPLHWNTTKMINTTNNYNTKVL